MKRVEFGGCGEENKKICGGGNVGLEGRRGCGRGVRRGVKRNR